MKIETRFKVASQTNNVKTMRQKYVNKMVSKAVEEFQIKEQTPQAPKINHTTLKDGTVWNSKTYDLFANIAECKVIYGYITTQGLDAWKRGTIEAKKIATLLATAKWEDVQLATPQGKSMWD